MNNYNLESEGVPGDSITSTKEFLKYFDKLEPTHFHQISDFPSIEEAMLISSLDSEILLFITEDGRTFIAKGDSEETTGIGISSLYQYRPTEVIHTHPTVNSIQSPELKKLRVCIPSPTDLAKSPDHPIINRIWNEFGVVTYRAVTHKTPLSVDLVTNALKFIVKDLRGKDIEDFDGLFNGISKSLNEHMGCGFTFQPWDELKKEL